MNYRCMDMNVGVCVLNYSIVYTLLSAVFTFLMSLDKKHY